MGQPFIDNATQLVVEPVFLTDEEGRPLFVPLVKATFTIGEGELVLAPKQVPASVAGEPWGKPGESSYKYEPEAVPPKLATDVALIGHAYAPRGATEVMVAFQAGPLRKVVRVLGDRGWFKTIGSVGKTSPRPFEKIPLVWERAFGGWDRAPEDPKQHRCEGRNPVGVGFRSSSKHFEEGLKLPNLEDPAEPLESFGQRVAPAGFGFVGYDWEPRPKLAGTYDEAWSKDRMPLLPKDFDPRFYNGAAPGLTAPGLFKGGEQVAIVNGSPRGKLAFRLPAAPPPKVRVALMGAEDATPPMALDTVIVDTDADQVLLLWRGRVPLADGPHDVTAIHVESAPEAPWATSSE
ncbi:MAG TPA: DUF2169 domain-containing protein [Myxococcaceae bacterium]|nr:DUF2169 domain-containing protein [Myxococcaceae bacterium]